MYKDLAIWHKSMDLVQEIYTVSDILPKSEDYNLKSQIRRAIVSVVLNIAEGKSRNSSKDFPHFLNIDILLEKILELNKMINSLRSKLLANT